MPSREKILESLLDLSTTTHARTRPVLLGQVLHTALLLAEGDGAAVLTTRRRRLERVVLGLDRVTPDPVEAPASGSDFTRLLLRIDRPVVLSDLSEDARTGEDDGCPGVDAGPALFVPLRQREHAPGYLAVYRKRGRQRFGSGDTRAVLLLSAWASMALENQRLSESIEKLAVTDDLTQVYNYRFIKTALRREIKRAGRFGQELSLVMIDVDNLKAYNDRHGHLRGSFLLKEIASLLAAGVRSFDLIAKYGGDEFTVILPQTGREGAMIVAERLRQAIADHTFPLAAQGAITISLGAATFPADETDGNGLIRAADRALYRAKQQGRNRVETQWTRAS
jgi:diguanylate cyclase (GGDEF)-like protein